jgi:hypothetical protein
MSATPRRSAARGRVGHGLRCALVALGVGSCKERDSAFTPPVAQLGETGISVGVEPALIIGRDGDARYEFAEIVGGGRFSSGEWVLFDRGSRQLRVYTTRGEHLRSVGRAGDGPGEFRDVLHMSVGADDGSYIYDQLLRRVTVVDGSGRIAGTFALTQSAEGTVPAAVGFAGDAHLIVQSHLIPRCRQGIVSDDTAVFYSVPFQAGGSSQVVAREPGMRRWGNTLNVLDICMGQVVPFAPGPVAAVTGSAMYVAVRDQPVVRRHSMPHGEVQDIHIEGVKRRAVTREAIDRNVERQLASAPRDEIGRELPRDRGMQLYERRLQELPYPDSLPLFDRILIDPHSLLWLRLFTLPADTLATWIVTRSDGSIVERLQLPARFKVFDIGAEYIAGQVADELDVQRFVVYSISRLGVP